jgi:hypothetical protein
MQFLEKFTKLAEKAASSIEQAATNVTKTYQEKGLDGFVEKTTSTFESLSQRTQNYYNKIGDNNKAILKANDSDKIENKIGAVAAVVVNTTQTILSDATQVTISTVKNVLDTEPAPIQILTANQISDEQLVVLDSLPLSNILKLFNGVESTTGMPNKWTSPIGTIQVVNDKWYNFSNGEGGQGAYSLTNALVAKQDNLDVTDPDQVEVSTNTTLAILQEEQHKINVTKNVSLKKHKM